MRTLAVQANGRPLSNARSQTRLDTFRVLDQSTGELFVSEAETRVCIFVVKVVRGSLNPLQLIRGKTDWRC